MISVPEAVKQALSSSSRFIKYKVEIYFDGLNSTPTDITEDVMSLDTLDETVSGTLPFGEVTYNELTIELDNISNKYTITNADSPYANKLLSGIPVKVTYLVETTPDVFVPVVGGVYYTDDWGINSGPSTATLTCYDYLSQVGYLPVTKFKVQTNITVYEAFTLVLAAANVPPGKCLISTKLAATKLPYYWCSANDLRTCLSDLALMTQCVVFVDKYDTIHIEPLVSDATTDIILSDGTVVMTTKNEPSYSNVYSGVNIKYPAIIGTQVEQVYRSEEIVLQPGINQLSDIILQTTPIILITGITVNAKERCNVVDYYYTDSTCSLTINNTSSTAQIVTITIEGQVLKTVENTFFTKQDAGSNNILDLTLPIPCTIEYVQAYADSILSLFVSYIANIDVELIGYPIIDIHDRIYLDSDVSNLHATMQVVRVTHIFNNGMVTNAVIRYI